MRPGAREYSRSVRRNSRKDMGSKLLFSAKGFKCTYSISQKGAYIHCMQGNTGRQKYSADLRHGGVRVELLHNGIIFRDALIFVAFILVLEHNH